MPDIYIRADTRFEFEFITDDDRVIVRQDCDENVSPTSGEPPPESFDINLDPVLSLDCPMNCHQP